ncbi:cytosolic protein [Cohnella kolymensis]|uniref:Cytosolic protein n=2 Tax=Cohnella kolymensis TaxID=1590652 RepID=A0ABR5A693_9BACL|nr:cytosolic protein [Cohnella kolymensis]
MKDFDFLSDTTEKTETRFVTFITPGLKRFDLAILTTNRFYGKKLVTDLQFGRSAILGPDDLEEDGVLEAAFRINEEEASELAQFLVLVLGEVIFTD